MCSEWTCPFNEDALGNKSVGTCIATNLKSDFRLVAIWNILRENLLAPTKYTVSYDICGFAYICPE